MIYVRVDDRARFSLAKIPDAALAELRSEFEHSNPDFFKRQALGHYVGNVSRVIATWREEDGFFTVPRGGYGRVRKILEREGLVRVVEDHRTRGELPAPSLRCEHELRTYQERMVDAALSTENCLVRAPTGSGKSTAVFGMIERVGVASLVIVWERALQRQWAANAIKAGLAKSDIGFIGDGKWQLKPFTVATNAALAYNLRRLDEVSRAFGAVFYDEVQRAAAKSVYAVVDRLACRYRIGVSADETRKDKREKLIYDLFGRVACEVMQHEVEAMGATVPVEIVTWPTAFEAPWYDAKVSLLKARGEATTAGTSDDYTKLLGTMATDDARNAMIVERMRARIDSGLTTVALVPRVEQAKALATKMCMVGYPTGLLVGEQQREFEKAVTMLARGELKAAIGTVNAFGTGLDVPRLGAVVLAQPLAANPQLLNQVRGRACRAFEGKEVAFVDYLLDERVFPEAEAAIRKRFPGRARRG